MDVVYQVLLLSVEFTPFEEEMVISVNSTVLLSTTVRLKGEELIWCVSTVRVTSATSPLLLRGRRPAMSAIMFPTLQSSMKNVYLVVSWPAQSSSLCR